jgi:hypothetical protein
MGEVKRLRASHGIAARAMKITLRDHTMMALGIIGVFVGFTVWMIGWELR